MKPSWVLDLWPISCSSNVLSTKADKDEHFKLPLFHRKRFASIGMPTTPKLEVQNLVEKHGCIYCDFDSTFDIDILIMGFTCMSSEEYNTSIMNKMSCLRPDWVHHSVKKGLAVPIDGYNIFMPPIFVKADDENFSFDMKTASTVSHKMLIYLC